MKILGYGFGAHNSGISLMENEKVIFSLEEERHCRVKSYEDLYGNFIRYPIMSSWETVGRFGLDLDQVDYIATHNNIDDLIPAFQAKGWHLDQSKYIKVDHHDCHAYASYFYSGFQSDSLVLAIDAGGGNNSHGKYYFGRNGELTQIASLDDSMASFGLYYTAITEFLELKRVKDEGKVVGMSSHGSFDPFFYELFNNLLKIENGIFTRKIGWDEMVRELNTKFYEMVGGVYWKNRKNDLAYNAQLVFEERVLEVIQNLKRMYPSIENVALSGGIFANIKLNKKINDLDWVKEVFVIPFMGDEGVNIGASIYVHKKKNPSFMPVKLPNVFMGTSFTTDEVINYWDSNKFSCTKYIPSEIAFKLASGEIIGVFRDRYEHGPRALGNRSILGHPGLSETYKKVNDRLQRNDFMPFAPSVLVERADEIFYCKKSKYTAEFMTMLFDTKEEWQEKIPAVVHPIDKTARAQMVTKQSNEKFHELISEFEKITGIPLLLNTSFNVHGEPILSTPQNAFQHLENGIVDGLVINNLYFTKK